MIEVCCRFFFCLNIHHLNQTLKLLICPWPVPSTWNKFMFLRDIFATKKFDFLFLTLPHLWPLDNSLRLPFLQYIIFLTTFQQGVNSTPKLRKPHSFRLNYLSQIIVINYSNMITVKNKWIFVSTLHCTLTNCVSGLFKMRYSILFHCRIFSAYFKNYNDSLNPSWKIEVAIHQRRNCINFKRLPRKLAATSLRKLIHFKVGHTKCTIRQTNKGKCRLSVEFLIQSFILKKVSWLRWDETFCVRERSFNDLPKLM